MKTTFLAGVSLALVLTLDAGLLSQQSSKQPTAEYVEKLIQDLDARNFTARDQAAKELLRLEGAALAPLKKALTGNLGLEATMRCRKILQQLEIFEPGGEVAAGLKLRLTAAQDAAKMGETLKLTTSLANVSDQDLNVQVGYTTCGNYFDCGSTLRRVVGQGKEAKEETPRWQVGFCGTGAVPMNMTIPARTVVKFDTDLTFTQKDGKAVCVLGASKYSHVEMPAQGTVTFRMVHSLSAAQAKDPGHVKGGIPTALPVRITNPSAPTWSGTVRSNDIEIKLLP